MSVPYALRLAVQSLLKEKWINILSVLTIGSGLLINSMAFFAVYNIDAAAGRLPDKFSVIIYLEDNLQPEKRDVVVGALRKNSSVLSIRYIPKDEALKELKNVMKNAGSIFEGLGENPLPDSLELKLRKEAMGPEAVKKLAADTLKIKGVKEVDYGEKFVSVLNTLKVGMDTIGVVLIAALSTGIVFVCYSTVKILFYRRKEEIETFKLLGATKGFIRAPFIIEGAVIGTAGGAAGLLGMLAFYYLVLVRLSLAVPVFKAVLFPLDFFVFLPLVGMVLGIAGAFIAIGRLRY